MSTAYKIVENLALAMGALFLVTTLPKTSALLLFAALASKGEAFKENGYKVP
jgi:hypothetical protein